MIGTIIGGALVLRTSMLFALTFFLQFLIGGLSGIFIASPVARLPGAGLLHHRRALPLHAVRRQRVRLLRRGLPLVPEDHRPSPRRAARQACTSCCWRSAPTSRSRRCSSSAKTGMTQAHSRISPAPGLGDAEPARDHRRRRHRAWRSRCSSPTSWVSLRGGEPAGDDPWLGHTLEWATSSPPPRYNFDRPLPPISSYAPLLDWRERAAEPRRADASAPAGSRGLGPSPRERA